MLALLRPKWRTLFLQGVGAQKLLQSVGFWKQRYVLRSLYSTMLIASPSSDLEELCNVVSHGIGSLDDLVASLDKSAILVTSSVVAQVLDSCKGEAPTRRMLRFFLWSGEKVHGALSDESFNHAIRIFAEKKDFTAMDILISDLSKEGRAMETITFSVVADALVKLGREDEALGIFKNLEKMKCPQDSTTVTAIVSALCSKGHARRAEGVIYHHKDKISGVRPCIYRSLLYGWSMQENVKESRRIIKEMKSAGINPDLFCFNTFLKCLCMKNLKSNPSGLVPEALNVMVEMRTYGIAPTSISYNILLSCLGRTRRVKESLQILDTMSKSGCLPDWVSYFLVARVLYLTGRFGKGKQIVDKMIEEEVVPDRKFYYDLIGILCGVERANYALELFERMKKCSLGGYGPVYDLLIPKFCKSGDFGKGRELWDEAMSMGLTLQCSAEVLDPTVTEVFKPVRKVKEQVSPVDHATSVVTEKVRKSTGKGNKVKKFKWHKKKRR